jgi:hypothetical protein
VVEAQKRKISSRAESMEGIFRRSGELHRASSYTLGRQDKLSESAEGTTVSRKSNTEEIQVLYKEDCWTTEQGYNRILLFVQFPLHFSVIVKLQL